MGIIIFVILVVFIVTAMMLIIRVPFQSKLKVLFCFRSQSENQKKFVNGVSMVFRGFLKT